MAALVLCPQIPVHLEERHGPPAAPSTVTFSASCNGAHVVGTVACQRSARPHLLAIGDRSLACRGKGSAGADSIPTRGHEQPEASGQLPLKIWACRWLPLPSGRQAHNYRSTRGTPCPCGRADTKSPKHLARQVRLVGVGRDDLYSRLRSDARALRTWAVPATPSMMPVSSVDNPNACVPTSGDSTFSTSAGDLGLRLGTLHGRVSAAAPRRGAGSAWRWD